MPNGTLTDWYILCTIHIFTLCKNKFIFDTNTKLAFGYRHFVGWERLQLLWSHILTYIMIMLTLPEHLSSPPGFGGVDVIQSLVLCVMFSRSFFVPLSFSFNHCVACRSLIYGFWLPLWYLPTLLMRIIGSNIYDKTSESIADNFNSMSQTVISVSATC